MLSPKSWQEKLNKQKIRYKLPIKCIETNPYKLKCSIYKNFDNCCGEKNWDHATPPPFDDTCLGSASFVAHLPLWFLVITWCTSDYMYVGIKRWLGYKVMVRRSTPHLHPLCLSGHSAILKTKQTNQKNLTPPPSRKQNGSAPTNIIKILVRLETSFKT